MLHKMMMGRRGLQKESFRNQIFKKRLQTISQLKMNLILKMEVSIILRKWALAVTARSPKSKKGKPQITMMT